MRFLTRFAAASLAAMASLAIGSSAGAVIVGVSSPTPDPKAAGADPLGNSFVTNIGGLSWQMGTTLFNTTSQTFGDGLAVATIFRFTINNGVVNGIEIDPSKTFFTDLTTSQTWSAALFNAGSIPNQRVEFTAPGASKISPFDKFIIRVGYVTPVSPTRYSWSASWDNTFVGVPEPATWGLMIGGFGLAGVALRRRRAVAA
jgi:hypothetical protein